MLLCRRWWNSCQTCFRALSPVPDQVTEVPKIFPEDVSLRTAVREPQLVEQLVEVPTVVSWSLLQRTVEQNVDIPAVGGSGTGGGLSGFLPGQYYSMTAEQIVDNTRKRPAVPGHPCLGEPRGPQARIQQRTMEQLADVVPMVQILDFPVPQMVEQLPDVMRFFDFLLPVPEQVIEVPKILLDDVPMRTALRDTQLAGQLVEVPMIIAFSSLQRTVEHTVDSPVPSRGGRISGLQDFLPRQSSTALHVSPERISERLVEQNVDFPAGGGLQDFLPRQSSSASSSSPAGVHGSADGPGEGVFRTFLQNKKVRSWVRTRGWNCSPSRAHPPWQLMWITGSMASSSGSALTLCMGHSGRSCCQTAFSGTCRGNGTDGSTVTMGLWVTCL